MPAKRILVIEDDKMLRDIIVGKLIREGFKASAVFDGESGLSEIKKEKFDLILLDLLLPRMSGFEVLEEARASPRFRSIPIIIISNLGQKPDIDRAMKAGADDYFVKANFTPEEIVKKVKAILKKRS